MIAIVDYGMANLRSVERALARVGGEPIITSDASVIDRADRVVLPGVGAFCACMTNLDKSGLTQAVRRSIDSGKPFLGICVGLQMLFDSSTEMGNSPGMSVFPGRVVQFFEEKQTEAETEVETAESEERGQDAETPPSTPLSELKVPHIGWNSLCVNPQSRLVHGIQDGERVYFVHSYYPVPDDPSLTSATSDYGIEFCCAIERDNVSATHFHPEKSGNVGLRILRNFLDWK